MYSDIRDKTADELRKYISLGSYDNTYNYPVHYLAEKNNVEGLTFVLDKYPQQINFTNAEGNTALHISIMNNSHQNSALLLERGANYDSLNGAEETPLSLFMLKNKSYHFKGRYLWAQDLKNITFSDKTSSNTAGGNNTTPGNVTGDNTPQETPAEPPLLSTKKSKKITK